MRAFVLTDPSLAPLANDFVWLTIDTEKDSNAAFVERFTNHVWPTLWVIDAAARVTGAALGGDGDGARAPHVARDREGRRARRRRGGNDGVPPRESGRVAR